MHKNGSPCPVCQFPLILSGGELTCRRCEKQQRQDNADEQPPQHSPGWLADHEFETESLVDIKQTVNRVYPDHLVLINVGPYWNAVKDDAEFFHQKFDWAFLPNNSYKRVSTPIHNAHVIRRYCKQHERQSVFICEVDEAIRARDGGPIRMLRTVLDKSCGNEWLRLNEKPSFRHYTYAKVDGGETDWPYEWIGD